MNASRQLLIGVGLMEQKKTERKARYIPLDAFWVGWWLLFVGGLILPTYAPEPFVVFPSVLALAVVWLFGMAQFTHTLPGTDLRDVRLTPAGWKVLVQAYQEAGIPLPAEAMTDESAQAASKELAGPLPGMARQSVLDLTTLAALRAVLAGFIAMVGLLAGPSLSNVHWWHGWSPGTHRCYGLDRRNGGLRIVPCRQIHRPRDGASIIYRGKGDHGTLT